MGMYREDERVMAADLSRSPLRAELRGGDQARRQSRAARALGYCVRSALFAGMASSGCLYEGLWEGRLEGRHGRQLRGKRDPRLFVSSAAKAEREGRRSPFRPPLLSPFRSRGLRWRGFDNGQRSGGWAQGPRCDLRGQRSPSLEEEAHRAAFLSFGSAMPSQEPLLGCNS